VGNPKGHAARSVPIPRFLADELAEHIAGKGPDELVFVGPRGGAMRATTYRRIVLRPAAEACGFGPMHPHELRHVAASLAIASGAPILVVQQLLGHQSAVLTLGVYGHLYGDQLDALSDALDSAARAVEPQATATVSPIPAS
jgi:integrase